MKIEDTNHMIIGQKSTGCKGWSSLSELGYGN